MMSPGDVPFARPKSMDRKGDIIITSDMHIKLVGMVKTGRLHGQKYSKSKGEIRKQVTEKG